MIELLFGWMSKPKIAITFFDELIILFEAFFCLLVIAIIFGIIKEKNRKKVMKRHGKHCTCFTCMGVN